MITGDVETHLASEGWAAITLPDPSPVLVGREDLCNWLRLNGLSALERLDDYHQFVQDDDRHFSLQYSLAENFWSKDLARSIVLANFEFFRNLLGPDLLIQRRPYLRIVRPGKFEDAVPLHRDTYYNSSPYELSIFIPFTEVDASSALRVISGSHVEPDSAYPYTQQTSADVAIGSEKHRLGYPYAPRVLDPDLQKRAKPIPLSVGQALIFGLSLVHGGGTNQSAHTRFSTDIRLVNSLVPVRIARGVDAHYYVPLSCSAISLTARRYLEVMRCGEIA